MNTYLVGSLLAMLGGIMVLSYNSYAENNAWVCGSMFKADFNLLKLIAVLALLGGFVEMFFVFEWYWAIASAVAVWLASGALFAIFRANSQFVSILLLVASVVVYFVMGASVVSL